MLFVSKTPFPTSNSGKSQKSISKMKCCELQQRGNDFSKSVKHDPSWGLDPSLKTNAQRHVVVFAFLLFCFEYCLCKIFFKKV